MNEQTFQTILLKRLLEPSDKALVLEPQPGVTRMELIIDKLLHSLLNCEHEENKVGFFECVLKTAFGLPDQTKYLKYEAAELAPIVQQAMDILNRKEL